MAKKTAAPVEALPPMRITEMVVQNFMRISEVRIRPDGGAVVIAGDNEQGKTSLIDAIDAAVRGKGVIKREPIREGQEKALIKLNLGPVAVTRTFHRKGDGETTTGITVEDADGRYDRPQQFLDAIVGELAFDPSAFADRMKPEEQYESIKALVPDCDFDALEDANEKDFAARTELNRKAKQLRAQAEGIDIPIDAPKERIDDAAILVEFEQAAEKNASIERQRADRDRRAEAIASIRKTAAGHIEEIAELRRRAEALAQTVTKFSAAADADEATLKAEPPIPEPVDISMLRARADAAKANNAIVEKVERRSDIIADAEIEESRAADLTAAIDGRKLQMQAAIEAAKLPVAGLSLGEKAVTLNGLPFDQASDAVRLRVSIAIGAAMNPTLRVMRVRAGSLLDKTAMKAMHDFAVESDMQIWIERVGTDEPTGFIIENGRVKSAPQATE